MAANNDPFIPGLVIHPDASEHRYIHVIGTKVFIDDRPAEDGWDHHFLGMHGSVEANMAMYNCDVMINIGARFDDRVTGKLDAFAPGSRKIHVDIDPSSINKTISVDIAVIGDAASVLEDMLKAWKGRSVDQKALKKWWDQIAEWRKVDCFKYDQPKAGPIKPQHAIDRLYALTRGRETYVTTEVGQHQMWAMQRFKFEEPNHWMTSGGLGTMGYGLPAAVGVQMAHPDALVIDIAGEASIQMNIQELATATQYRLPVKIFILNNEYMGMVRQWQELTYESRYAESYSDSLPDFVKLAEAYGWKGIRIETRDQLEGGIADMLAHDGPVMVDCMVAKLANCFPMIPSGAAHTDMILQANEVSGTMDDEAKALVDAGLVSSHDVLRSTVTAAGMEYVDILNASLDPACLALLSPEQARLLDALAGQAAVADHQGLGAIEGGVDMQVAATTAGRQAHQASQQAQGEAGSHAACLNGCIFHGVFLAPWTKHHAPSRL